MAEISASLDFLLCVVCLAIAIASARRGNDFLCSGLLWVTAAALAGTFNLGGMTWVDQTHRWLSQVARGPGTLAIGLGVVAATFGAIRGARWMSPALAIGGAGAIHLLTTSPRLETVTTILGSTLLLALLVLAVRAFAETRLVSATAAVAAVGLLLAAAFGANRVPLATDGLIRQVDILHVLLICSYTAIWLAVRDLPGMRLSLTTRGE